MRDSPTMKQVIEALARKHGVDLIQVAAHLRLDLPHFDRLVIETLGFQRMSVAHYSEMNGDLVAEPEVVFFTGLDGNWIPIEITQSMTGWSSYVQLDDAGTHIERVNTRGQADLAAFTEQWAQNLINQGWLARGVKHEREAEIDSSVWPEVTTPFPGEDTLQGWMMDGSCEATDGCMVEPDGLCPHGHPSWLLKLGLI